MILLLFTLLGIAEATERPYIGYSVYRLIPTEEQVMPLYDFQYIPGFDIWKRPFEIGDYMDIMVSGEQQNFFKSFLDKNNIDYTITIGDVQQLVDKEAINQDPTRHSEPPCCISFTRYHRHSEINNYLQHLASKYPNLVTLETIGKSYEGRDMIVIKISSGKADNRPAILIDSGIHAREWITPAMSLYIINQLVQNNTANRDLTKALDWYILPVVNPDGYEYSHKGFRMWRKSRSPGPASHPHCVGVDINRNFEYKWESNIHEPCSESYSGLSAASEPETKAIQGFALSKNNIKLYLTFHSYGSMIIHPWGYTSVPPSDIEILQNVAKEANAEYVRIGGKHHKIGNSVGTVDYMTPGNSMDYMKGVAGIQLTYAVELTSGYEFELPENRIESFVTKFFVPVRSFANYVVNNYTRNKTKTCFTN